MVFLQAMTVAFGVVMLLGAVVSAVAVFRVPRFRTRDAAFLLSVACVFGGLPVAAVATPDWSPITMLLVYAPFLCIGVVMAFVSSRRRKRSGATSAHPMQELSTHERRLWAWLALAWLAVAAIPVAVVLATLIWDSVLLRLELFFTGV